MADKYYPDEAEPHLHIYKTGVTFTNVGHRHKTLQTGSLVYRNVCRDLVDDLKVGNEREQSIATWIEDEIL